MSKIDLVNDFRQKFMRSGQFDDRYDTIMAYQWIENGLKMVNQKQSIRKSAEVEIITDSDRVLFPGDYVRASNSALDAVKYGYSNRYFEDNNLAYPFRIAGRPIKTPTFYIGNSGISQRVPPIVNTFQLYGIDRHYLALDSKSTINSTQFLDYRARNRVENFYTELTFVENLEDTQTITLTLKKNPAEVINYVALLANPDPDNDEFLIGSLPETTARNFINLFNSQLAVHNLVATLKGQIVKIQSIDYNVDFSFDTDNEDMILESFQAINTLDDNNSSRMFTFLEASYFEYLSTATDIRLASSEDIDFKMRMMYKDKADKKFLQAKENLGFN